MTKEQHDLVKRQLQAHQRESGIRDIVLDKEKDITLTILIERGVFGSDIVTTANHLARFLYHQPELYKGKDIADIGCGPGTQGIIMSKYGARSVVFADINPNAVANTQENIKQQNIINAEVYKSNLFDDLPKEKLYDVIVFNHPFFPEEPEKFEGDPNQDEMLRRSMLGGTALILRFFEEVSRHLRPGGIVIMPYFHFAGTENDPATHIDKYGLKIIQEHKIESKQGLQQGDVSIYVLSMEE